VADSYDLARAFALYRLILEPVASVLADKQHLIVVPTGPLTSLPFQVLLTGPPVAAITPAEALRAAPWLIRRHALSVLPSVQSLSALRRSTSTQPPTQPFLGIGDPDFSGLPQTAAPRSRAARGTATAPQLATVYRNGKPDLRVLRSLSPLPETADELRTIAKVLGAPAEAVWLGADATERHVKQTRLDAYRVIHFATHGIVAGELDGIDEPALVLTVPEAMTELDDGLLTASEIASLQLRAEWVVLSACNTASGSEVGAEALSGLARAFFHAGARGLLVSHWEVESQAAVALTTRTFTAMATNPKLGRAEAFRRTILGLIDADHPPSYWAPFVIVGEGAGSR
jgi:CHAT domain-containing protein